LAVHGVPQTKFFRGRCSGFQSGSYEKFDLAGRRGAGSLPPVGERRVHCAPSGAPGASDFSVVAPIALSCGGKALALGFRPPGRHAVADGTVCSSSQARIASRIMADALRS
jgi:hypothetical protein